MRIRVIIEDNGGKILVEKTLEVNKYQVHRVAKGDPDTSVKLCDPLIEACVIAEYLTK